MHPVPHATFEARLERTSGESHPPGEVLAIKLEGSLRDQFAEVGAHENWRDCGWSVDVECDQLRLHVYFAPYSSKSTWLLAVAPLNQPGLLARAFGPRPSLAASALQRVSATVHTVLAGIPLVGEIRWMFGGPPEKVSHVANPSELPWRSTS